MILAEIITIGEELLIGQIADSNSTWMAQQLNLIGVKVKQMTTVSDNESDILSALAAACVRADIVLITGGLGPTKDDITKQTLCKYFNTSLRLDEKVLENIGNLFKARGRTITETNRKQAEVPVNCEVLHNAAGTAPGMWFETLPPSGGGGAIYVSMPGVPFEMKNMMQVHVLPRIRDKFILPVILHKNILVQGIGESNLSDLIAPWEDRLPHNMNLAYLPNLSIVRLRITATGVEANKLTNEISAQIDKLKPIAVEYIFGYDDDTLEKLVGDLLREKKMTLSTAESFTGGYIAHLITTVAGSSDYYTGSVIAYDNRIKSELLDVKQDTLYKYGAVSEETVKEMALGVQRKFKTNYSIATTGVAGPSGGSEDKPVGTVWIGIATPEGVFTKRLQLGNDRGRTIISASQHTLNMLRKLLAG